MTHSDKVAREGVITEALRAVDQAIGDEEPTDQALRIIKAIQGLRDDKAILPNLERIDYLGMVQEKARASFLSGGHTASQAVASVDTPLGRLKAVVWQREWTGGLGKRTVWASEYYLDDEPITINEAKAAGLSVRPTSRNRRKRT